MLHKVKEFVFIVAFHAATQIVPVEHLHFVFSIQNNNHGAVVFAAAAHIVKCKDVGIFSISGAAFFVQQFSPEITTGQQIVELYGYIFLCHSVLFMR